MDFAQNYTTINQDAIKSDHYGKQQITIHPIPCYYRRIDGSLVRESVIIVSDDLNHDAQAVSSFRKRLIAHLRSKEIEIRHLIEWCNGAPTQYKLAQGFANIAEHSELNIQITRSFFEL